MVSRSFRGNHRLFRRLGGRLDSRRGRRLRRRFLCRLRRLLQLEADRRHLHAVLVLDELAAILDLLTDALLVGNLLDPAGADIAAAQLELAVLVHRKVDLHPVVIRRPGADADVDKDDAVVLEFTDQVSVVFLIALVDLGIFLDLSITPGEGLLLLGLRGLGGLRRLGGGGL